jgi:hypothetical protein
MIRQEVGYPLVAPLATFFLERRYKRTRSPAYTQPYEYIHAHLTSMSTSGRLSRWIVSWNWRSYHRHLAVDGNITSHWMNISLLWDTQMLNLGFELWWDGDTTILLTTQALVDSPLTTLLVGHRPDPRFGQESTILSTRCYGAWDKLGVMFWLTGAYDPFILKCILYKFWNIEKIETKIHTYIFSCYTLIKSFHENSTCLVACVKRIKFGVKNNTFNKTNFLFFNRP